MKPPTLSTPLSYIEDFKHSYIIWEGGGNCFRNYYADFTLRLMDFSSEFIRNESLMNFGWEEDINDAEP